MTRGVLSSGASQALDILTAIKDGTPVEKTTAVTTQVGAATAVFYGHSISDWAALTGIVIAILSFGVNAYVAFRRLRLDEEAATRRKK